MAGRDKLRLDQAVLQRGLAETREKARKLIVAGRIRSGTQRLDKPGKLIDKDLPLLLEAGDLFVSRGGQKLEGFLEHIQLDATDLKCLDVGASTGGFTDCLLQRHAQTVTAVDVGHGLLHWKCRNDPRVVVLEKVNARYLTPEIAGKNFDLAVIDVAFISLKLVCPSVMPCIAPGGSLITLVKPQFEAGRKEVGRGGVVHDKKIQMACVTRIKEFCRQLGLTPMEEAPSVIKGPKGNQEYFIHFKKATAKQS